MLDRGSASRLMMMMVEAEPLSSISFLFSLSGVTSAAVLAAGPGKLRGNLFFSRLHSDYKINHYNPPDED